MRQPAVRAGLTAPRSRGRVAGALVMAALATAACYTYVPVSMATVASNDDVRVRVTEEAAARLSEELGTFSTEIDGQFAPAGPDSVSVGVAIDRAYHGMTIGTTTQVLLLGRSEIVDVRKREFSRSRTVLVTAGAVTGFALLAAGIVQLVDPNGPSDNQTTPPPPSPSRRPRGVGIRIPIP